MYKPSRLPRTLYSDTVKMNDEFYKELREQFVMSDDGGVMFGDEVIHSPGQLGIKILQLLDHVKDKHSFQKHERCF